MTTQTAAFGMVETAISGAGLYVTEGPADVLPTEGGKVAQAVVLWPSAGLHQYTRMVGTRSGRSDRVRALCVGSSARDALAVADKLEAAIGGMRLSAKGGTLRQTFATDPVAEPNADPVRVSLYVEYSTITKKG